MLSEIKMKDPTDIGVGNRFLMEFKPVVDWKFSQRSLQLFFSVKSKLDWTIIRNSKRSNIFFECNND